MASTAPRRFLLIDDHALIRSGLRQLLRAGLAGVEVTEAGSIAEALRPDTPVPDLVLLDIELPGLNGIEGIAVLRKKWPAAPVIVLSSHVGSEKVEAALARGAAGFVSKAEPSERIFAAIDTALRAANLPPAGRAGGTSETAAAAGEEPVRLTPRQAEVLDLLCEGMSNKLIGKRLDLSENTVRGHVQALLAFLQVASRTEAMVAARRQGLVR